MTILSSLSSTVVARVELGFQAPLFLLFCLSSASSLPFPPAAPPECDRIEKRAYEVGNEPCEPWLLRPLHFPHPLWPLVDPSLGC